MTPATTSRAAPADTVVLRSYLEDAMHARIEVVRRDGSRIAIATLPEDPVVDPRPVYASLGERELRSALVTPVGHDGAARLPVLLSPYGGPHGQEVVRSRSAYREQQWFADRLGVAVLTIDGRGTPGRGTEWERSIHLNFALTLDDQIDGLRAAADAWSFLDLDRVAMRGWSYGGWISAFAVLTRPDVFHAAVAGAPVTDFRLYDTFYTERYLGLPDEHADVYERDAPLTHAAKLTRPLLLIHGLADDNVVAANTLQLSAALFRHGYPARPGALAGRVPHRRARAISWWGVTSPSSTSCAARWGWRCPRRDPAHGPRGGRPGAGALRVRPPRGDRARARGARAAIRLASRRPRPRAPRPTAGWSGSR